MSVLDVKNENWNTQAALFLEPACNDDYTINDLAFDTLIGVCSLFNIYENGQHIASMVLRLDNLNEAQRELVVVALGGGSKTGRLIQNLSDFWDDLARKNKAQSIRAHVSKKGMAKLMERVGGHLSELVYKKEVHHGRAFQ